MYSLILPFVRLSFFAINPQDLPASRGLLVFTLVSYGLVSVLIATPLSDFGTGIVQSMIELLLLTGFTLAALRLRNHPDRSAQTLTALAGTGALLSVILLPFLYLFAPAGDAAVSQELLVINFLVIIWLIAVYGHIFRHALSVNLMLGIMTALAYLVITTTIINRILSA